MKIDEIWNKPTFVGKSVSLIVVICEHFVKQLTGETFSFS